MPNHVKNIIKMKGIGNLPLFKTFDDGTRGFDFNTLIKMPEELNMTDGSIIDDSIAAVLMKINSYYDRNKFGSFCITPVSIFVKASAEERVLSKTSEERKELEETGMKYINNILKYGYISWYKWCCDNWGTKWNAYENEISEDEISFETAWSNPEPVIMKLAEKYPDARIEHYWADEDAGHNSGYRIFEDGKWEEYYDKEESDEAYIRYNTLWHECYVKDENGEFQHKDCENCDCCKWGSLWKKKSD